MDDHTTTAKPLDDAVDCDESEQTHTNVEPPEKTKAKKKKKGKAGKAPAHLVPGEPIRVRDLVAAAEADFSDGEKATYGSYIGPLLDGYTDDDGFTYLGVGDKWVHKVLASDLKRIIRGVRARAVATTEKQNAAREAAGRAVRSSVGDGAVYNAVGAYRRIFQFAVDDKHLAEQYNPAPGLDKPTRSAGNRRPLDSPQLNHLWDVVLNTGNDPELDAMIVQSILILAARRGGLIKLAIRDIDRDACMIRLTEKNGKVTNQPVPDWFAAQLYNFAHSRGSRAPSDPVFRYKPTGSNVLGDPLTSRRLDNIFGRIKTNLAWADKDQVVAHTLRHHAHGVMERYAGGQVAEEYVRHEPDRMSRIYGRATPAEVATAVVGLFGGSHPLVEAADEHRD